MRKLSSKRALLLVLCTVSVTACGFFQPKMGNDPVIDTITSSEIIPSPGKDYYGFLREKVRVEEAKVKRNESLYVILRSLDVSPQQIYEIQNASKDVFRANRLKPNQKYFTYLDEDSGAPLRLILHESAVDYVIFDWSEDIKVVRGQKEVRKEIATASGEISSSLYETLVSQDVNILVANRLSEIFAWQIDFFRIYPGDKFNIVYEKQFVGDKSYGIGRILGAEFTHQSRTYDAFYYETEESAGFYDSEGKSVQKALLKAPFTYSQRISSGFSHNRFHPVLKRNIPHYGVDYAAPLNTPVISVGDGEVIEAQYRGANGNIVKIKHNGTYTTAYLHLNGFGKGIKKGVRVKQGQVIGYVGRTGRVTGVHLDYRIYKNNQPVNPLRIELPPSKGISQDLLDVYQAFISPLKLQLDQQKLGEEEGSEVSLVSLD